ncbi:hypothetical protein JCM3770_006919 [Rhodotorula araucariae]
MSSAMQAPNTLVEVLTTALPRFSRRNHAALAHNLAGVWWGLRTAVLIDSCMLSEMEAQALGRHLEGASLTVLYEPVSEQTLVADQALLKRCLCNHVSFVDVGGRRPVLLEAPPPAFNTLVAQLTPARDPGFLSLSLPNPDTPQDLVPLVGFLLDYPVAYSVGASEDGRNCLGGVELCVVEATLVGASTTRQRLLSFSYPISLTLCADSRLDPDNIVSTLRSKLGARLAAAQEIYAELLGAVIEVDRRTVVLDQVAL